MEIVAVIILGALWYFHDNRKAKIRESLKKEVENQVREEYEAMYSGTPKPARK